MRQRSLSMLVLTLMLLGPLLAAAPEALRTPAHEGVVHTSDLTWSGNMSLDEDITIASGATLTIAEDARINITEDITIRIEGDLVAEGDYMSHAEIWGSHVVSTGVQARWEGFQIASGANAEITALNVSDARGAFLIEAGGEMDLIEHLEVNEAAVGVYAIGDLAGASGSIQCHGVGASCLLVEGEVELAFVSGSRTGQVLRILSGGDLEAEGVYTVDASEGIVLEDGALATIGNLTLAGDGSAGLRATGDVDATIGTVSCGQGDWSSVVNLDDVTGFDLSELGVTHPNCAAQHLVSGQNIRDATIGLESDSSFGQDWAIDAHVSGDLHLELDISVQTRDMFRLRGDGTVHLTGWLDNVDRLLDVVGGGTLEMRDLRIDRLADGGLSSGWNLETDNVSMNVQDGTGLRLLSGEHELDDLTLARNFAGSDQNSVGLEFVWAEVEMDSVSAIGFNEGVRCAAQCLLTGDSLTAGGGGRDAGAGLVILDGGSVELDWLSTASSDIGIDLIAGDLHLSDWTVGASHRTYGIALANDSNAVIRSMPGTTSAGAYDGFGDGNLLWGSAGNPNLAVSNAGQFTESNVRVTDLVGSALPGSTTTAHGFTEVADAFGDTTLPLLSSGSLIEALDAGSGMGTSVTMSPPGGNLQIAVIPASGDWTIPAGVHARLVGDVFTLNGDLIIESTASLTLVDANLSMPAAANLSIAPNARLRGDGGHLSGGIAAFSAGVPLAGEGAGLSLDAPVTFTCYDPWTWARVSLSGDLTLSQDCELILDRGSADGPVSLGTDAILSERSHLLVTVLDAGAVVEGANVSVGGSVAETDVNGEAAFASTWRVRDGDGETTAGLKTVAVQHANVNRYRSWTPSLSTSIEVMISTVAPGATTGLVRLEPLFSPYHLGADLTVTTGTTFEVLPDVELTIAPAVGITVDGVMRAESAWIGGTGSNGIAVMAGQLVMQDGFYSGGALDVQGWAALSNMRLSDAPVMVGGAMSMLDGSISNIDVCIHASGVLSMTGTSFTGCGMYALWATDAQLEVRDITLDAGNSNGAWVQQGSGNLSGWNGTAHDGDGPALFLQMVDDGLVVTDLHLSTGAGEAALRIEQSDGLVVSDSMITGAPAVQIEESAATLLRVDMFGAGVGAGLEVLGAPSEGTAIIDCDIDDYATAARLEGGIDDVETAGVHFLDSHLHATVSVDANTLPFLVEDGVLEGEVRMLGMEKPFTGHVVGHDPSEVDITGEALLLIGHDWTVSGPAGMVLSVNVPEFEPTIGEVQSSHTDPTSIRLFHRAHTEGGMTDALQAAWSAAAPAHLPAEGQLLLDTSGERILEITLSPNALPIVEIDAPDILQLNAGISLTLNANASDPDGDAITEWVWTMEDGDDQRLLGDAAAVTFELEQGTWTVRAHAFDSNLAFGEDSIILEVAAADADNDFIDSCPAQGSGAWWDAENGRFCGPDVYDEDDDNDGIRDDRDRFPRDACANRDTDDDGAPDSILPNCETDLVADQDDDGDGVPDAEDLDPLDPDVGRTAETGGERSLLVTLLSPTVVLSVAVLVVFTLFAYLRSDASREQSD